MWRQLIKNVQQINKVKVFLFTYLKLFLFSYRPSQCLAPTSLVLKSFGYVKRNIFTQTLTVLKNVQSFKNKTNKPPLIMNIPGLQSLFQSCLADYLIAQFHWKLLQQNHVFPGTLESQCDMAI